MEDKKYNYMLLDRLREDCKYFLGNGNRNEKYLWAGNVEKQIEKMKELYNSFSDEEKPEWIDLNEIEQYEKEMLKPKEITNIRFKLFLEQEGISEEEYLNKKLNLNVSYMGFIDKYTKEFEEKMLKKVVSNQTEFDDYLKYKILGDKVYNIGKNASGIGKMESFYESKNLLLNYKIEKENDQTSLYPRLENRFEDGQKRRVIEKYNTLINEIVPEEYKTKYMSVLGFNKEESTLQNYCNYSSKLAIARNIENVEENPFKIKFLVEWSESSIYSEGHVYSLEQIENRVHSALDELDREKEKTGLQGIYNKVKLVPIFDNGKVANILEAIRFDVGSYSTFDECLKNNVSEDIYNYMQKNRDFEVDIQSTKRKEFEEYEQLTPEQKIHLADFEIINSIRNSTDINFTQDEEERLLDVIKEVWLKDETNIDLSTIGDKITEAYANKAVSLETLERSNNYEILDCIIDTGNFESLENKISEEDEL